MKIMIVGCGKVGSSLAEQLNQEGHEITLIDIDQRVVEHKNRTLGRKEKETGFE